MKRDTPDLISGERHNALTACATRAPLIPIANTVLPRLKVNPA